MQVIENKLWEILVPEANNSGQDYPISYHQIWDEYVKNVTGGLTILKPAKGIWVSNDGVEYKERMIPVRIQCSEETICEIAGYTLRHYDQEAVMFHLVSEKSFIINK